MPKILKNRLFRANYDAQACKSRGDKSRRRTSQILMNETCDIVHTVTDYYDGPRGGIANFHGRPHIYSSVWDEAADDWSDTFLLLPIDDETFRLAMEDWAIWCRWERAFHAGQISHDTHPALPNERVRHDDLEIILTPRLTVDPKQAISVRGRFETRSPAQPGITSSCALVVFWCTQESVSS